MKDALAIHRMLLERETLHEIVRLPRLIANADELPEALGLPEIRCLATRVYVVHEGTPPGRAARSLAAVVVAAGLLPPAESVRLALGARTVRRASAAQINAATDYTAGLVAPLLLPDRMPILVDQQILDAVGPEEVVYTTTGEPSTALGIRLLDLLESCPARPARLPAAAPQVRRTLRGRAIGRDARWRAGRH